MANVLEQIREKAKTLGIKIMNETEFLSLIENAAKSEEKVDLPVETPAAETPEETPKKANPNIQLELF